MREPPRPDRSAGPNLPFLHSQSPHTMADSLPTSPGAGSPAPLGAEAQQPPIPQHQPADAWQRVGDNRYMPRRIKGSLLGRELG